MYNDESTTSSSGESDDDGTLDDLVSFGECVDGEMVTCDPGTLVYTVYTTDDCADGTVNMTMTSSHDVCYMDRQSVGCPTTDPDYASDDEFDIAATHYSEDTCETSTSSETIAFGDIDEYIEATLTALYSMYSTSLTFAEADPIMIRIAATSSGACSSISGGFYSQALCIDGTVKHAKYETSECSDQPVEMESLPGCMYTDTDGDYVKLSCESSGSSGVSPFLSASTTPGFLVAASAALVLAIFGPSLDR